MSLQDTMNAAREAAANVPAVQDATGTALANSAPDQTFSTDLDDFLTGGGIRPDKWIQVKDAGIRLDRDDKAYITEFEADLDLSQVQIFWGARAEFAGNNVVYTKSYDGQSTTKGENFKQVLAEFKANSLKNADPYRGADMLLVLTDDVTQGKTTVPAGTKLGYTTSITGFTDFQTFLTDMRKQGKFRAKGDGDTVRVKVSHEAKSNDKNQEWGILNFQLVG